MDLIDRLKELSARIPNQLEHLQTEEATKNALVMPFIQALGYDVFNPLEVVPEYTADVGTKRGEKVDYVIMRGEEPIILIECKASTADLDKEHASQLYRYFSVTAARFGLLTNGVVYRFFSDLEEPNKMDSRPFFEFSMLEPTEQVARELRKFARGTFDLDEILNTASDLKYTKGIRKVLAEEWVNPSEELVRLLAGRVYSGRMTQSVRQQFAQITKQAFHEFLSERVNQRLKSAIEGEGTHAESEPDDDDSDTERDIVTTEDEWEGYYIVKAILSETIDPRRVFVRDRKRYCAILLDDTNRKPICRLWFNTSQKYLGLYDAEKDETRNPIDDVDDIYRYANQIKGIVARYEGTPVLEGDETETRL